MKFLPPWAGKGVLTWLMLMAAASPVAFSQDVPPDPETAMIIEPTDPVQGDGGGDWRSGSRGGGNLAGATAPDTGTAPIDDHNPVGVSGIFNGNITTGGSYDPLSHSAHRAIDDIVVPGSIGKYPLKMTRYYNSRAQFYTSGINMGPGWSHEYSWQLWANGGKVITPQGNTYDFFCEAPAGMSEGWEDHTDLDGTWRLADGGRVHFSSGRVYWIDDPYGQRTTITYDGLYRRYQVIEPGGRYLQFFYEDSDVVYGVTSWLLTRVEAHGLGNSTITDWVNYTYTSKPAGGTGVEPRKVLTKVTYSDGTATAPITATYTYRTDNMLNAPEFGSSKYTPLVSTCADVRYAGPMRQIAYDYQEDGPHGAILTEKYSASGPTVSSIAPALPSLIANPQNFPGTFTETRGDGPTRSFTYTDLSYLRNDSTNCPDVTGPVRSQFLLSYTDFQGNPTTLRYDANWYVNYVQDARGNITLYVRGNPPVGEIKTITHPAAPPTNLPTSIQYTYISGDPHYVWIITDERGSQTIHTRDPVTHQITHTDYKDSNGVLLAFEDFTYNNFGQVLTHRLRNGAWERFAYDSRGLLTDKWNPKSNSVPLDGDPHIHYAYYASAAWADRVLIETRPANGSGGVATQTYEYDRNTAGVAVAGRGLVTKIMHADSKYRSFGYSQFGNKMWEENELRQRTSFTYDNYNRVLTVTRTMGADPDETTTYTYKPTNGSGTSTYLHTTSNPDTVTTPTGIITANDYDENFRKISSTAAWNTTLAATTSFGYDEVGNQTYVTDPRGAAGNPTYTTTTDYDTRNRKWHVTDPQSHKTTFTYDGANNVTRVDHPDLTWETKTYDGLNRVLTDTVPQTSTVNLVTSFIYNPSGTVQQVTDAKGLITTFQYDASDQKISMTYPAVNGLSDSQSWAYDDAHNLKSRTTVHGEVQSFDYDNRNRKIEMSWSNDADWATYAYDYAGRLTDAANPNSTVHREYDAAGRLTLDRQTLVGTTFGSKDVNYDYDLDGKLTRMWVTSASYDYTYSYDIMGRFEKITPTGGALAFQYYYDAASNETQRYNNVNGVTQKYTPDSLNRMSYLEVKKGGLLLGSELYGYDTMSRIKSITREDAKQDQFSYYSNGELKTAIYGATPTPTPAPTATPTPAPTSTPTPTPGTVAKPAFAPAGGSYPYHSMSVEILSQTTGATIYYTIDGSTPSPNHGASIPNGGNATVAGIDAPGVNLQAMAHKNGMIDSAVQSDWYYYDGGQSPDTSIRSVTYNLDKAGNRISVVDTGVQTNYSTNELNQYYGTIGGAAIYMDVDHQIGWYKGWSYWHLNDERLMHVQDYYATTTYDLFYDALGRCVKRTLNGITTYYVYDGEKPVLEYNTGGGIVGRNVYGKGIDEILMRTDPAVNGAAAFYYQQDHEGSVTHLTNAAGSVKEEYRYDVFGAPTFYNGGGGVITVSGYNNRFLFTGREYAATFGVYEYRARAYHPALGRFMSEDPKLFAAGDYNLFRYCDNDPLDLTDPMGLETNWSGAGPQNPENHAAIAMLAEIRNLRELTGAGGAISTGMLNYAIGQLQQGVTVTGQATPSNGTQNRQSSSNGVPTRFRILEGQTKNHGTWNSYEYQAYAKGKPVFNSAYEIKEEFTKIYSSKNVDFQQTKGWTPLNRGRWGDDVGFHGRLPKMALDIREQRFHVRPVGDHGDGTLMQSHFLHMSNVYQGRVDNVVGDMGSHGYFDQH